MLTVFFDTVKEVYVYIKSQNLYKSIVSKFVYNKVLKIVSLYTHSTVLHDKGRGTKRILHMMLLIIFLDQILYK